MGYCVLDLIQERMIMTEVNQFYEVRFIMEYEDGELTDKQIVEGFQHLIDSGVVWSLQGRYGRMATRLINGGDCHR